MKDTNKQHEMAPKQEKLSLTNTRTRKRAIMISACPKIGTAVDGLKLKLDANSLRTQSAS
jgi:hypothetical protein